MANATDSLTVLPKYQAIADRLIGEIEQGHYAPGDRLPSEAQLSRDFAVSLGTLQKALALLARRGLVVRRHGAGTFVAGTGPAQHGARTPAEDLRHFRFLAGDGETILPVFSRVLTIERSAQEGPWSRFLRPATRYIQLTRILRIGDEFDIYSEMTFPEERARGLLEIDPRELDGVLIRDYMHRKFRLATVSVEQDLRIALLPPRVCGKIGTLNGTPGLVWDIRTRSFRNAPGNFQRVYIPQTDRPLQILEWR